jgi:hypothetical protein
VLVVLTLAALCRLDPASVNPETAESGVVPFITSQDVVPASAAIGAAVAATTASINGNPERCMTVPSSLAGLPSLALSPEQPPVTARTRAERA